MLKSFALSCLSVRSLTPSVQNLMTELGYVGPSNSSLTASSASELLGEKYALDAPSMTGFSSSEGSEICSHFHVSKGDQHNRPARPYIHLKHPDRNE